MTIIIASPARARRARRIAAVAVVAALLVPAAPALAATPTVSHRWSSAGWLQVAASAGSVEAARGLQRAVTVRACVGSVPTPWRKQVSGAALRQVVTGSTVSFPSVLRSSELPRTATGVAVTVTTTYPTPDGRGSFWIHRSCAGTVTSSSQR